MVRLDIAGFKSGGRSQSMDLEAGALGVDSSEFEGIHLDVDMDRNDDQILIRYSFSATAHLICDRTSEPFAQEVQGTHALYFVPHDRVEALADGTDDVLGFDPSDTFIDIAEAVHDSLLLSVPIRKIAPGADDIEIPTTFGDSGQDIDPRWEALRGLKDKS